VFGCGADERQRFTIDTMIIAKFGGGDIRPECLAENFMVAREPMGLDAPEDRRGFDSRWHLNARWRLAMDGDYQDFRPAFHPISAQALAPGLHDRQRHTPSSSRS
jgi:hypothetical protein